MEPEAITSYIEKCCIVETKGDYSYGMMIVDWFDKLNLDHRCKVVTSMNYDHLIKILIDSVLD